MTSDRIDTLRSRLRADTAHDHEALDAAISELDIATRPGFLRFMQTHHAAFRALDAVAPMPVLRELADRAGRDIATLGETSGSMPDPGGPFDPHAVDYVLHGSRLGTKVLRRRWQCSTDPQIRAASAYFAAPIDARAWRSVCNALAARPSDGPAADRIVADVRRIFAIFGTALANAPREKGRHVA